MQTQFFPSRTMAFYMAKMFLVRTLAVLAALVLVLQALDLLGEADKILAAPGNDNADLWRYVLMRTPQIIQRFLPFSVLLGTLITMVTLNQNSEVISMKASGLSAHQVLAPLMLASLGVAAIAFTFNERIVTRATATLNRWQKVDYALIPMDSRVQADIWVRDGHQLINAGSVEGRGARTRLSDVSIYVRSGGELPSATELVEGPLLAGVVGFFLVLGTIFRGVWPLVVVLVITLVILLFFPSLSLWLPSMMD